jgi:hypothetical protein
VAFLYGRANVVSLASSRQEEKHHDSIPHLELSSAASAVDVCQKLLDEGGEQYGNIYHWTDSECVLKQIQDVKTRQKAYVNNRLSIIREISEVKEWFHIDTQINPADHCSRGLWPGDPNWHQYHYRDPFLKRPKSEWLVQKLVFKPSPVYEANLCLLQVEEIFPLIHWSLRLDGTVYP